MKLTDGITKCKTFKRRSNEQLMFVVLQALASSIMN